MGLSNRDREGRDDERGGWMSWFPDVSSGLPPSGSVISGQFGWTGSWWWWCIRFWVMILTSYDALYSFLG